MLSQLLRRFRAPAPVPAVTPPIAPIASASVPDALPPSTTRPTVAFTAQLDGDSPPVQVIFPYSTRQHRVEPEAVVYCLHYREFDRAIQYLVLHGQLRKQFNAQRIPLATVNTSGLRDDDILANAIEHARDTLWAIRNPVEVPEVLDPADPVPAAPSLEAAVRTMVGNQTSDPAVATSPGAAVKPGEAPVFTVDGEFMSAGVIPYKNPATGKLGKPSFAVWLNTGSTQLPYYGSDLQRAIRQAGVLPGDRVRLVKYPKHKVHVGDRVVPMNIWDCTILDRA
jgi:hypothetical protein